MTRIINVTDTHSHLDGEEFKDDLAEVIQRAKDSGVGKIFIPGIDESSLDSVFRVCDEYPDYCYPMVGLQPEEVKDNWKDVLMKMKSYILPDSSSDIGDGSDNEKDANNTVAVRRKEIIAIGECGLDFYWSRDYEKEQLAAFEKQVEWSVATRLPLMIHCRKAQNELLHILKKYEKELPGGVFHCFTGNQKEAEEYLKFDNFVLGIGGVSTFKSSHLREDLPQSVPLNRIVLETDSPYMAPVPYRGKRNESGFVTEVCETLAICYGVTVDEIAKITNENVERVFPKLRNGKISG